jgi:hypothetical protein
MCSVLLLISQNPRISICRCCLPALLLRDVALLPISLPVISVIVSNPHLHPFLVFLTVLSNLLAPHHLLHGREINARSFFGAILWLLALRTKWAAFGFMVKGLGTNGTALRLSAKGSAGP